MRKWAIIGLRTSYNAGENEGLGGLVAVVSTDVKRTKTEEAQVCTKRRYALRAELDALVVELNEQDTKGGSPAYPTWREDEKIAEHIFLETPCDLPVWLERMRMKNLSKQDKFERVLKLSEQLTKDAIIAIPPERWRSVVKKASEIDVETKVTEEGGGAEIPPAQAPRHELAELTEEEEAVRKESAIMRRLGFIFVAYRVNYWWWEGIEMFRKFLMTWFSPCLFSQLSFPAVLPCLSSCPACAPQSSFGLLAAACCVLIYITSLRHVVGQAGSNLRKMHAHAHMTACWRFFRRRGLGSLRPGHSSLSSSCFSTSRVSLIALKA
jgi:hypothetical protein